MVRDSRKRAFALADSHSEEKRPPKRDRSLIVAIAAMNTVTAVARSVLSASEEAPYGEAVRQALSETRWMGDRFARTETYEAYQAKYRANWADAPGHFVWDAILDRRTCETCADLDQRVFASEADVPDQPHASCRCTVFFEPA